MKTKKIIYLFSAVICLSTLYGCNENENDSSNQTSNTTNNNTCYFCENLPTDTFNKIDTLSEHQPTTFVESSVNYTTSNLCDGVNQYSYTLTKNNDKKSKVMVTEVDLTKASITAGTNENKVSSITKSNPYSQIQAFLTDNPNYDVISATNADFFGTNPVNAFVKDSIIVKNGHNDNGIYDYTDLSADIPASMPMLFGISGNCAKIAPIIQNASKEQTIKSKLFYELTLTRDNKTSLLTTNVLLNDSNGSNDSINIITRNDCEGMALAGTKVLCVEKHSSSSTRVHGKVKQIQNVVGNSTYIGNDDFFYIIIPNNFEITDINEGDIISYNINSADDTWKYYDTILGCRQALVIDGNIADTVNYENSNGAQSNDVPRTSIGIMPDGKVAIFSVESMYYGKKSTSDTDPHGMSLPELADFMRYYGVYSGANFDGGGSTQLISKNPSSNELEVLVRSSDFGTYNLSDSRSVINTLLVYIEKGN